MQRGLCREAGPAVHARNRRARPQGDTGELLTSYSQIKRTRLQEPSSGQSEVEGPQFGEILACGSRFLITPTKEKRLGSAPGAEFIEEE